MNGRIPSTLVSKIQAHTREFELICSILPVSGIVYEKSAFDMHAIVNPEVLTNKELYQKGHQYGYENTKAFVLYRDYHTC
ncbi:MAG: RRXRR domain-containing protein [Deltaproteobacteria bacterium]|nr:RRXRR domain-containing protein [Deltaproteobacteria bacterium]